MGGGGNTTITNTAERLNGIQIQSSAYGRCIPLVYGTQRLASNLFWYDDFVATPHTTSTTSGGKGGGGGVTQTTTTYTYSASLMFGLCEGQINGVGTVWVDKSTSSISALNLSFYNGSYSQSAWGFLTSNHAGKALPYRGTAYLACPNFDLGDNASLPNLTFEVKGMKLFNGIDSNPKELIYDFLTNDKYGIGFPSSKIGDLTVFNNYCLANNILLSPMFDEQKGGNDHIQDFLKTTNSSFVWSEGKLKIIPYGDSTATANGVTYTPNLSPVYDLTDNDFVDLDEPIKVTRTANADAFNHIKIEFLNRANSYNAEIAEAKDLANIDLYGLRPSDTIIMHSICDAGIAKTVAQLLLQRALYIRNIYEFKLSWKYCLLEPMDLVTLTDELLGFDKLVVRITEVSEDDEGILSFTAEDFPFGVASATLYQNETVQGTVINYNIPAGNSNNPIFFEPPLLLSNNYEVWLGVSGAVNWGGAEVWVSSDSETYTYLTKIAQPTRMGAVVSNWVSGNTVNVDLTISRGELLSTSEALAFIGGEVIKYSLATLTSAYHYTLTVIERGLYGTSVINHSIGEQFMRLDSAVMRQQFTTDMIGKAYYYKFLSFNIYGVSRQALEDVEPYAFTIKGDLYPPATVTGFAYEIVSDGILLRWNPNSEIDIVAYEIRTVNDFWGNSAYDFKGKAQSFKTIQKTALQTYYIKAIDSFGNYSKTSTSVTVAIENPTTPSNLAPHFSVSSTSMAIVVGTWDDSYSVFGIDYYLIEAGDFVDKARTNTYIAEANWLGDKTFSVTAVDKMGFASDPATIVVSKQIPNPPQNFRFQVVDNNVLFYWDDPILTTLPITSYELRKGETFASSTLIGKKSGGFTTVFESSGGVFTYWITSIDADNRYSNPISLTATVSQPPDFILNAQNYSVFDGTKVNVFSENGTLVGPFDTIQTWTTHYINNSWTTPQAQINAGYPIYAQPTLLTGYYEEIVDLGTIITSSKVSINVSGSIVSGNVVLSCDISLSEDNITWIDYPNSFQTYGTNFRYYKFKITFIASDNKSLYKITEINSTLDTKIKNDGGNANVYASDTGGTTILFNVDFVDITSITVTAQGTTPALALYDFVDEPYPTSVKALLFNPSTGTRIDGKISWNVKGF